MFAGNTYCNAVIRGIRKEEIAARKKLTEALAMLKQTMHLHCWEEEIKKIKGNVLAPIEHYLFSDNKYCGE